MQVDFLFTLTCAVDQVHNEDYETGGFSNLLIFNTRGMWTLFEAITEETQLLTSKSYHMQVCVV